MCDDRVLCVETADGFKPIENNGINECLRCGVAITEENDSGWQEFVEGGKTQSVCKKCEAAREQESFNKPLPELLRWAKSLTEAVIDELGLPRPGVICAMSNANTLLRLLIYLEENKDD